MSRFLSGGIGGITSQLSQSVFLFHAINLLTIDHDTGIYPIETMKVSDQLREAVADADADFP